MTRRYAAACVFALVMAGGLFTQNAMAGGCSPLICQSFDVWNPLYWIYECYLPPCEIPM